MLATLKSSGDDGRPRTHRPFKVQDQVVGCRGAADDHLQPAPDPPGPEKGSSFQSLKLPESFDWLQPQLMKGKTLDDAEARAYAPGTCGLSAQTCLETSRAHADQINALCKSLPPLTDDPKEDVAALKAWRDSIRMKAKEWLHHVQVHSDVGAKLLAALFSKETQFICQELAKAPRLALAKSILLRSSPTTTHLFSDNARVIKAIDAADKHRPFVPKSSYNCSRSIKPWGAGTVTMTSAHQGQKPYQRQKAKAAKYPSKKAGNPKGCPLQRQVKRGGRKSRD
jgi:hypothetical protein